MTEEIAAYLDGELGAGACAQVEEHLARCARCSAELALQRRLMRELDSALAADDVAVEMPANFAQVVAARAQCDMSGVRGRRERGRALRLCALLAAASFALLGGGAVSDSVLAPLGALFKGGGALLSFLSRALFDAGTGVAVISRGFGGRILFGSPPLGLVLLALFAAALFTLRRLIAGYHRGAGAAELAGGGAHLRRGRS